MPHYGVRYIYDGIVTVMIHSAHNKLTHEQTNTYFVQTAPRTQPEFVSGSEMLCGGGLTHFRCGPRLFLASPTWAPIFLPVDHLQTPFLRAPTMLASLCIRECHPHCAHDACSGASHTGLVFFKTCLCVMGSPTTEKRAKVPHSLCLPQSQNCAPRTQARIWPPRFSERCDK